MTPARPGPRRHITTASILQAVATRGRWWTAVFRDEDVSSVNEAVERELLNGNLHDAQTLSPQGEQVLAEHLGHPNDRGRIDLRIDHGCRDHDPCWTIRCVRCETTLAEHLTDDELEERVQAVIVEHACAHSARPHRV